MALVRGAGRTGMVCRRVGESGKLRWLPAEDDTMSQPEPSEPPVIHPDPPPLRVEEGGVIKVGRGRVSLDLVVEEFERGKSPEEIVRTYDALNLPDVYGAIAYYLRHRDEVKAYIAHRDQVAEEWKARIEAEFPRIGKSELLARRAARAQAG
jgi:uncharacterized protein (DUF433 family)